MSYWLSTVGRCEPEKLPRRCRWFGHDMKLDEMKTHGGRVRLVVAHYFFQCRRCGAREIRRLDCAGHQIIDMKWLEDVPK